MKKEGFTKEHSLILKGCMVFMLLFHHVFFGNAVTDEGIILCTGRVNLFYNMVSYGKLCLSGFAFISAYGITRQLMSCQGRMRDYLEITVNRLVKLSASCVFVYVIAIFYKRFVVVQSIKDIYRDMSGPFHPPYMLLDALGLADLFDTPTFNVTWWYFSYAIMLICALPAIFVLYRKIRIFTFPLVMFFLDDSMVGIAALGVLFAYEDVFGKLRAAAHKDRRIWAGILVFCLVAIACSYSIVAYERDSDSAMYWAGAVYAVTVMLYLSKIPVFSTVMKWIGRHSATIFMTHTLIYMYFYKEFIYSFRQDYLIYIVLFVCSMATAVVIDALRRLVRYDKLVAHINEKIKGFLRTMTEGMSGETHVRKGMEQL
ncbi:MAG: hypothetical protein K2O15_07325 [Lachnospiraceae bacterium]|nr:hypothetical protein [Lachnospiraceae bacterium]